MQACSVGAATRTARRPTSTRVTAGDGDAGLPHGAALLAFAEAVAGWDDDALAAARDRLVAALPVRRS